MLKELIHKKLFKRLWFVLKCNKDHITHQKPSTAIVFSLVFAPIFDISINIHEYVNEMSFILTHAINIFVINGITGAITSCHYDRFGLKFVYLWILKTIFSHF